MRRANFYLLVAGLIFLAFAVASVASCQPVSQATQGRPNLSLPGTTANQVYALNIVPDYPGFWKVGNLVYAPCAYKPYESYIDPSTGYERYMRYDFSSMRPNPYQPGQPAGYGGANHTEQWYDDPAGKIRPIEPQPDVNGYYPGPPEVAHLCDSYLLKNPGMVCPTASETIYNNKIAGNAQWISGRQAFIARIQAECSNQPTPTRTPSPGLPTPTPVPGMHPAARYITWLTDKGITAGCGPSLYCPNDPVRRDQIAVYLYKLYLLDHPTEPLPACKPTFADVPCQ